MSTQHDLAVRLYFFEPRDARKFDIKIQDRIVPAFDRRWCLPAFSNRLMSDMREFVDIRLVPRTELPPIISGVEIIERK